MVKDHDMMMRDGTQLLVHVNVSFKPKDKFSRQCLFCHQDGSKRRGRKDV